MPWAEAGPLVDLCVNVVEQYESGQSDRMEWLVKKALQSSKGLNNPKRALISR